MFLTAPRGFRDPARVQERIAMLDTEPRIATLRDWASELSSRRGVITPFFDPADAGVEARVLTLFEAPGPMTNTANKRPGSGFISVDNDDQTAENVWRARNEVGLHEGVLGWNITPWFLGPASKKPTSTELAQGASELRRLLPLLPELRAVVLSGRFAQRGWHRHVAPYANDDLVLIETWHPSPLSLNKPGRREDFTRAMSRAAAFA